MIFVPESRMYTKKKKKRVLFNLYTIRKDTLFHAIYPITAVVLAVHAPRGA